MQPTNCCASCIPCYKSSQYCSWSVVTSWCKCRMIMFSLWKLVCFTLKCCHMFSWQLFQPAPGATIPAAPGAPVRRRRFASSSAGCLFILNALSYHEFWNPFHLNSFVLTWNIVLAAILMGPQTPSGHMENQTADSNNPLKRPRPCETSQEVLMNN